MANPFFYAKALSNAKNIYDVVIVGAGLGGLECAAILGMEGYKVCLVEKNKQLGGNLQIFSRNKRIFDTGVHYIGGLDKGQNLYQYFKFLGIMDDLKLRKMDEDGFDHITFGDNPKVYRYGQGYDRFIKNLVDDFPEEEEAIHTYCDKIKEICQAFPLYNVRKGFSYLMGQEFLTMGAHDFICSITDNVLLQNVLAGTNILYAGYADKTPLYVHALVTNSYIESSYRCVDGGSQIAKLLVKKIRACGGEIYRNQPVEEFMFEDNNVVAVRTTHGDVFHAKHFISNVHPQQTLKMIPDDKLRRPYWSRISSLNNTTSVFSIHVVLKENSFPYLNHNIYHFDEMNVWDGMNYNEETWPKGYMLSTPAISASDEWADSLTVMVYMNYEDVAQWADTYNIVGDEMDRGESYEEFKIRMGEKILDRLEEKFPNIRDCIEQYYTSTPLTYRDYIGNGDGSLYGILKDHHDPLRTFISAKTKIPNLLLTGQNLNMHGILGVTVGAFITCSALVGLDYLMDKVIEANKDD